MRTRCLGAILFAGAVGAVQAQSGELLPEIETHGDVRVWSGGLGSDKRQAMTARAEDFDVKLVFSRDPKGAFEADVHVTVERAGETVVDVGGVGPWVFLDLPTGRYTIVAESRGETSRKDVEVREGDLREIHLRFTTPEA